jgi:branched-chain amino acid transport system substrate-binding protein
MTRRRRRPPAHRSRQLLLVVSAATLGAGLATACPSPGTAAASSATGTAAASSAPDTAAASSAPGTTTGTPPVGNATGVTPTSITVGQVDTLSGPVPGLFLGAKLGTQAYLAYVNSQGGVNGRKLRLLADDDQFSSSMYASETQSLSHQALALVGGFSLFDQAGVATVNAQKIPDVSLSLSSAMNLDQYNYSPQPLIPGSALLGPLRYLRAHDRSATEHVGTLDTSVATAEAQSNAVTDAMKSIGYRITYQRVANPVESDFTSDVLKMKAAGVQMVMIVGLAVTQVADLARQMHLEGFRPKIFATNGVAYDASFIPSAGAASADGMLTYIGTSMYLGQDAATVPAVATFDKWFHRVSPHGTLDVYAYYGWTSAQLFVQALRATGRDPTRASLLAQLDRITNFDASGMQAPADPAQKRPARCWIMMRVVNGAWRRVTPSPTTGYVCKPGGYYFPPGTKPFVRRPPPPN